MSAKEEHARNVDMHKMRRQYTELTKQNAALETACASLKIAMKDAFDKCSTMRETMTTQYTEKMNEMKTEFENEKNRLNEQAQKDASFQRARHMDSFNDIKRQLESIYKDKMNEHNAKHEALMQQLKIERAEIQEHVAQLAQDRLQVKVELEGLSASIKREEQANIIRLVMELDHERETMKCQLTEERKALVEQLDKEDNEKRQRSDNELAEMKTRADCEINERRKELAAELNHEWDIVRQKEKSLYETHQELEDGLKKKKEQCDEERDKLNELQTEINKAREETVKERATLDKERATLDKERATLDKERATLDKERAIVLEEIRLAEEDRTNLAKECNEIKREQQCQAGLMQSLMNEVAQLNIQLREEQEKHAQIQNQLKQRLETDNPLSKQLHDAVASNAAHLQLMSSLDFKDKRVAIYSHYSSSDNVESYNVLTVEYIQHYFDYVIILTNCPNKWSIHSHNHNKIHLLNYNMKSDFRNYGVFIMQAELNLMKAACMCLINDSFVVVDVNAFGQCIKRIFDLSHDFIGLTSSHESVFHMQSYFLHFNASTLSHVMNYFKEQGLPNNHDGAISKYELGISLHLMNHGFSQFAFVSNDDMMVPLNTTCVKWSEVLNATGIIKRQHFFKKYAYKSMSDSDISEVAEKYAYNKHFVHFLKYNNVKIIPRVMSV